MESSRHSEINGRVFVHRNDVDDDDGDHEWDITFSYCIKNRKCVFQPKITESFSFDDYIDYIRSFCETKTLHFPRWQQQWTTDDNGGNFFSPLCHLIFVPRQSYSGLSHAAFGYCQPKRILWEIEKRKKARNENEMCRLTQQLFLNRIRWFSMVWKFR